RRERGAGRLDSAFDGLAEEAQARVLLERARQQPGFGEDLEAVADPDDRAAGGGEPGHRVHNGREPGDRPCAEVVAVLEPAGDDDGVNAAELGVCVPQRLRRPAESTDGPGDVELAVRTGEDDDADARAHVAAAGSPSSIADASITGVASSRGHISSTWRPAAWARAAVVSGASITSRMLLPTRTCDTLS